MLILKYFAAIVATLTIAAICFLPGSNLPNAPFLNFDKFVHFGIFAILTILWYLPFWDKRSNSLNFLIALLLITYGGIIEIVQHQFVTGRTGDVFDLIANILGVLAVYLFIWKRNKAAIKN